MGEQEHVARDLTLSPRLYQQPGETVLYEVSGMPLGQTASIVQSSAGSWEVLWMKGERRRIIRDNFVTPDSALHALIVAMHAE